MPAIKVLVVDDSLFMRKLITRLVSEDPECRVVGEARNGAEAVSMAGELKPDVITMDVEMPVMNGLAAVAQIMKQCPTPVVMLSSLTRESAVETIEALHAGAVDFIAKPSGSMSSDLYKVKDEILAKIKAAAKTPVSMMKPILRSRTGIGSGGTKGHDRVSAVEKRPLDQIVAIGTSTGGPRALEAVLSALPNDFPHPVLVVQHMPPQFTKSLAQRLDGASPVRVKEAEDGEPIRGGIVYVAPGDDHLTVVEHSGEIRVKLTKEPPRNGHRPSVDVLFESVVKLLRLKKHYVLMTGMGSDGAKGMLLAKESGSASTIAEAKETCVVFGMPRAAIECKCVDHVVPVDRIAAKIVEVSRKI